MLRLAPLLAAASLLLTAPCWAQSPEPVGVLADRMFVETASGDLRAEGNVTITQGDTTLQTDVLIYNSTNGTIRVPGPLSITSQGDATVLVADFAQLDAGLQAGVISGARSLIDGQLQVAAATAERLGERYTVLNNIVASSCTICASDETPIWQIRASRAVRDAQEQRLHYENATLSMLGVPVLYLPYFSHPDAGVERATGFLSPSFSTSTIYGTAVKLPYYMVLDGSRDLTLTPYITSGDGLLMEGEYRQALTQGYFQLEGSVRLSSEFSEWRGYGRSFGNWTFDNGVVGAFDFTGISDDRFLADYGYSSPDRITSSAGLFYSEPGRYWEVETLYFDSLRANEAQTTVPFVLPDAEYYQAMAFGQMQAQISGSVFSFSRQAGRDVTRATAGVALDRSYITGVGLVLRAFGEANADGYATTDDPVFGSAGEVRLRSLVGVEARFPFISRGPTSHIIEPIIQLVHADDTGDLTRINNEDSTLVEFDETNLFSTNRFPGADRFETGTYANVGLRYESRSRSGRVLSGTIGRVYRTDDPSGFAAGSSLGGPESDYVISFSAANANGFGARGSVLMDEEFDVKRNEVGVSYLGGGLDLSATYAFLEQTALDPERAQLIGSIGYDFDDSWRGELDFRRDLEADQFVSAEGRLQWENECIRLAFSMSRNFAQSNNIEDETAFGLNIELVGVGAGRAAERHRERCQQTPGS